MTTKNTKSNTGIPTNPTIILFNGDPLSSVLNKTFVNTIPGFNLSSYSSGFEIDGTFDEVTTEDVVNVEEESEFVEDTTDQTGSDNGGSSNPESKGLQSPSLSDISLISNTVKYDKAGNPYAEVVIRVMNSSGVTLKGIKAKVGKI